MKIGFTVLLADYAGDGNAPRYTDIRSMARRAEAANFDSIWLYDHLLYRWPEQPTLGIWECWSILSALAEATERVEIGTLVLCNSFRNPALVAKMAETVDEISSGRLILGIGAGWNKPEYDAFGFPFDRIRARFQEAIQIIKPLLRERKTSFNGSYYQVENCEINPPGPRANGIPIMIGAFGPRMLRVAAEHADIWNYAYTGEADTFAPVVKRFHEACRETGRDPGSVELSALANVVFAELGGEPPPAFDAGDIELPESATSMPALRGSTEEMVAELKKYEKLGTSHLIFHAYPYSEAALDALARVVAKYRASSA
jgi:probable F420-dependent oxidoreductase